MARTRDEAVAAIRRDRAFWRSLVDEVGRDRMLEPGPMGEWTFRDLAAHLAAWRGRTVARVEALARGEPEPPDPWPAELDDDDRINDWFQERDRDRPLDDVLREYDESFDRLARALESLPESVVSDPGAAPWTGGEALADVDFGDHLHSEHVPSIRAWLASGAG